MLPWRTVAGNIAVPLQIRRVGKQAKQARVDELLALVGLSGFFTNEVVDAAASVVTSK
jgi:NitT/TauT family transport system ATP-binding protein